MRRDDKSSTLLNFESMSHAFSKAETHDMRETNYTRSKQLDFEILLSQYESLLSL
jgi:hypothetical protein